MPRFHSHINTARSILNAYKGEVPFTVFVKAFFTKEKKYGSRDRKSIASLCYNFFRLGTACKGLSVEEQLLTAHFLFSTQPDEWLQNERPDWNGQVQLTLHEKLELIGLNTLQIFPFNDAL